ncbi:PTS transporter subunit EIIB [Mesoplasma seiffertii]|uniref:PTS transporter subunit EIIB n=1 Tax=Mesoplasma seiffertii TaxID=28224 RepID=UPI00047DF4FC|nr:PTS transporter subunit EIIB [Mesoplasma seiffertii]
MKFKKEHVIFLLENIGGIDNIDSTSHCISRMRFRLKDISKANTEEIKKQTWCKGVLVVGGEYQVVIGTEVESFYKLFTKTTEVKEATDDELTVSKQKTSFIMFVSSIFSPLMILLVVYGMWEMVRTPFFLSSNSSEIGALIEINSMMELISKGLSWFIVMAVCWSTFKVMGGTPILGLAIGAILISPMLVPISALNIKEGETIIEAMNQHGWKIFGDLVFPWKISFEGLVIPMIFVGILGVYIEKGMNKVKLGGARLLIQPMVVIAVTVIVTMFTIAPAGLLLTNYMSIAFNYLMTHPITKYIFSPLIGMFYGPMVVFGLHRTITPILMQDILKYNGSFIMGLMIISNVCLAVGCLTFGYINKNCKEVKTTAYSNGISAFVAGVTEPAIYSISLKYVFPLIASAIGTYFGCLLYTAAGVWTNAAPFGILGLIGFASNVPNTINIDQWAGGSIVWGPISMLIGVTISLIMTLSLSKLTYFKNRTNKILADEYGYVVEIKQNKIEKGMIIQNEKNR